ncbi:MAG: endonuclease domain-containing protein [Eubacteriales bacterium]
MLLDNRIVIELGGSQHGMSENKKADEKRDFDLQHLGITVLRYTNLDINNNYIEVCEDILVISDLKLMN